MILGIDACFITNKYLGGKEQVLLNLIKGFVEYGKNIEIIVFGSVESKPKFMKISTKIQFITSPILNLKIIKKQTLKALIFRSFFIQNLINKYKIDILLMNISYTGFKKYSIPTILLPHDIQFKYIQNNNKETKSLNHYISYFKDSFFYFLDFKIRDYIIAISDFDKKEIQKHYPKFNKKIKRIYNPVITNSNIIDKSTINLGFNMQEPYIFSNNLSYIHKNLKTLLKAFDYITEKSNVKLVVSGSLYTDDESKELIKKLKEKNRLITTGYLEEKEFYYVLKKSSLFVNPSSFEGFGMSAVEAMISSVPCLLANNTATYEVSKGLADYYSPADNYKLLGDSIIKALDKEQNKENLKIISQKLKEAYSLEKITCEYIEFFNSINLTK